MKIRTGFVTNSSSESYGEVVIDNPILLEILSKYKAMGTFGENTGFNIGDFKDESIYRDGTDLDPDIKTITPAFNSLYAHEWYTPHSLDEVLTNIIRVMVDNNGRDGEDFDVDLFQNMEEELQGRADEITKMFIAVKWYSRQELYSGRFGVREYKFDQKNGEYYYEDETGCLDY